MSHRSLAEFLDYVTESFANLFNLDVDPTLDEADNVQKVIGQTGTVAWIVSTAVPIPASDFLLLTPIQTKMAVQIGKIKGFSVSQERAKEIVTEILGVVGMSVTAQMLIVSVAKLVPFVGGFLSAPLVYASTWAIGNVVNYYFDCMRHGSKPSSEAMKELFAEQFRVGKRRSEQLDKDELRRKADELRQRGAAKNPDLVSKSGSRRERPIPSPAPAPAPAAAAGRQKIKITLPPRQEGAAGPDEPRRMQKTIGFGDEERAAAPAAAPAPAPADAEEEDLVAQLERLAGLRQQGILTEEEFQQAKERLLG
ncbi:MAG: SHOCT domain-containing protein [Planctomycetota bacterium]